MFKFESGRVHLVWCALLALLLSVDSLDASAQAIPFSTSNGGSAASTAADSSGSTDSTSAKGSRGSHGAKDVPTPASTGAGASQGYAHGEEQGTSKLQAEPDTSAEIGKAFARVLRVAGDIADSAPDSNDVRHLKIGDSVRVGDHLQSSGGGELLMQASDASMVALRPASELWIESYAADGKPADHVVLRLVDGGARIAAGWIAHVNPAGAQVETPTATIGAGDSDHETFVVSSVFSDSIRERPGTYDKVNRGSTVMRAANQDLEIEVGHIGFVGAAPPSTTHTHTILLPASLEKVPAFYARGSFDSEMDSYVKTLDQTSDAMLQRQLGNITLSAAVCDPARAGKAWLQKLDGALARRDAARVQLLFTADARFAASDRDSSSVTPSHDVDRADFTRDMVGIPAASNASQQRISSTFSASPDSRHGGCAEVMVQSLVARRGTLGGKPYKTQSLETYHLDLIDDAWLAVSALSAPQ